LAIGANGALRLERGRWTERLMLGFLFDDLPQEGNTVTVDPINPRLAQVRFTGYSEYAQRGADRVPQMIDRLAEALPIERIVSTGLGGHSCPYTRHGRDGRGSCN